jgi:hypothetical protein
MYGADPIAIEIAEKSVCEGTLPLLAGYRTRTRSAHQEMTKLLNQQCRRRWWVRDVIPGVCDLSMRRGGLRSIGNSRGLMKPTGEVVGQLVD